MIRYRVEEILRYPVIAESLTVCIEMIVGWLRNRETGKFFACANPHSIIVAEHDDFFMQALYSADILTPDGFGIVLASKVFGGQIRERVTGYDIFSGLSSVLNEYRGGSYFFLGSTDETLVKISSQLAIDYPNIRFVGSYSPPYKPVFSEEDNARMIQAINKVKPDVLWVGMTAPKQEKWIFQNRDRLNVRFIGAIGAVFDFYAGNIKRSHPVFQRLGLEWLPRLIQEPRRLWRRTFISSPKFVLRVIEHRLKYGKNPDKDA